MLVDGKSIAEDIRARLLEEVKHIANPLKLGVIALEHTAETRQFLNIKQRFGQSIHVDVSLISLPRLHEDTEHLLAEIIHAPHTYDGLILQLPIPHTYDAAQALGLFPLSVDVDVLGTIAYGQFEEHNLPFLPPVVGAFAEILNRYQYGLAGRNVVVVGEGRLVGAPAAIWARYLGAHVTVLNRATQDIASYTQTADIIILGAGSPGLLTPDMVKQGVIVLDAGTSEEGGVVKGDADPAVAEKAALFTPTPGGVGPVTVAKVFENLLTLYHLKHKKPSV